MRDLRFLCVAILFLSACSGTLNSESSTPVDLENFTLDLFISRSGIMQNPEFEQYSLKSNKLFQECGTVRRDRFFTEAQDITRLEQDNLEALASAAAELATLLDEGSHKFDPPAKKERFFDPGRTHLKFHLNNKSYSVDTSLDAIKDATVGGEKKVLTVVKEVRKLSKALCGNNLFFGLTRG